jgi:hypothetical protein
MSSSTFVSADFASEVNAGLVAYAQGQVACTTHVGHTKPPRLSITPELLSCLPSPQSSQPSTPNRDIPDNCSEYDERNIRELTPEEPTQLKSGVKRCDYCKSTQTPMWRHGPGKYQNLCNSCGVKWRRGKILANGEYRHHLCKPPSPKAQKKRKESKSPKTPRPTPPPPPFIVEEPLPAVAMVASVALPVQPVQPAPPPSPVLMVQAPIVVYDPVPSFLESIKEPAYSRLEHLTNDFSELLERLQPQKTQEFISTLTHGYALPVGQMKMSVMDITDEKWDHLRSLVW